VTVTSKGRSGSRVQGDVPVLHASRFTDRAFNQAAVATPRLYATIEMISRTPQQDDAGSGPPDRSWTIDMPAAKQ